MNISSRVALDGASNFPCMRPAHHELGSSVIIIAITTISVLATIVCVRRCATGLEAPEMAKQLSDDECYNPTSAYDMWAFGLLLLEWMGIRRAPAHEQACEEGQAYAHTLRNPAIAACFTLHYASSLVTETSNNNSQQVSLYNLLPSSCHIPLGTHCTHHLLTLCAQCDAPLI